MSGITSHILDTSIGRPAKDVQVTLEHERDGAFVELTRAQTNGDGRVGDLVASGGLHSGTYRLTFATAAYFARLGKKSFYPAVSVTFVVENPSEHHHVPLLLNPFGYSTYRGS